MKTEKKEMSLNFTAEIADLRASNAALIQKIAEDETNLNQECF